MASRYWVGDVIGGDLWNNATAWSAISGGVGGAGVPGAGDDVFFDINSLRTCQMDVNSASLNSLDYLNYSAIFNQNGFTLTIGGAFFRLTAGMTFIHGNGIIDFQTAAGGPVLVTFAGKTVGTINMQTGAAVIVQQQDNGRVAVNFQHQNGIWEANGFNLQVDTLWRHYNTMPAQGFRAGTGTHTVTNTMRIDRTDPVRGDTSTFVFSGVTAYTNPVLGTYPIAFYNLTISAGGTLTTSGGFNGCNVNISRVLTLGAGAIVNVNATGQVWGVVCTAAGPVSPWNPDPTAAITFTNGSSLAIALPTGGSYTFEWLPCTINGQIRFTQVTAGGVTVIKLMNNISVNGKVWIHNNIVYTGERRVDFNGFNLTAAGDVEIGDISLAQLGFGLNIGAQTLTVGGNLILRGVRGATPYNISMAAGGQVLVTGNVTYTPTVDAVNVLPTGCLLRLGGSWNSGTYRFFAGAANGAVVRFTAAGAFTIACAVAELWPTVEITAGGSVTPPNDFNCYDLVVTNGTVTHTNRVTIRHVYTVGALGVANVNEQCYLGAGFTTLPGATVNLAGNGVLIPLGPLFILTLGTVLSAFTIPAEVARLELPQACTITVLTVADRRAPLTVVLPQSATVTVTTLTNNNAWPEAPMQLVSSLPGTQATINIGALSSGYNIWPRDLNFTGAVFAGGLSNKNLGNNTGPSFLGDGQLRGITDDPGADDLAALDIGSMEYCWLVSTSVVGLTALAAAFAAGANNWHRRTRIPFAVLDGLAIGTTYFFSYGLRDDRDRRVAPNLVALQYASGDPTAGGGGGGGFPQKAVATSKFAF